MKYKNPAIATDDQLLQRAGLLFCDDDITKQFGEIMLSSYSPATLAGYTNVMSRYNQFLHSADCWSSPPNNRMWQAILMFKPSMDSRQAYVRAKAVWSLYCRINSYTFPPWVAMAFDGLIKRMLPIRPPKPVPETKDRAVIMEFFASVHAKAISRLDFLLSMANLLAYYGGFR